jgi:hypothetical protein
VRCWEAGAEKTGGDFIMMKSIKLLSVFFVMQLSLLLLSSSVQADLVDERPDWWGGTADAMIIFDPIPGVEILDPVMAGGEKGYAYTVDFSEQSWTIPSYGTVTNSFINVDLTNEENLDKTKLFWVAFQYESNYSPNYTSVSIRGHYEDGSISPELVSADNFRIVNDWVYVEARLSHQPAWDEFVIQLDSVINGIPFYNINYLEIGTECVPIPSTLLLFGGGVVGLAGVVRRRKR